MTEITPRIVFRQYWFLYALLIVPMTYLVLFQYYPIIVQFILSFKKYQLMGGIWGSPWVGFANFETIFSKPDFYQALSNTIIISLLRLLFGFLPPLFLAILLFDLRSAALKRISQTIIYIPHFFSWVIVYGVTYALLSNLGLVNDIIRLFGGEGINFLMSTSWFRTVLVGSGIWKEIGWGTIIYLAGLSAVNPELYESAMMDGAGPWRRIWNITLPTIRPLIIFLLTLSLGHILSGGVEQILLYYSPATYSVGDIIDTWVYRQGLGQLQYSLAASAQFFQSLFGLILVLVMNHLSRRFAGVGIW